VAAVWLRLRAELRASWRPWLTLAALAGVAGGLVIATAAGARRIDSALARWEAATETMHVSVGKGDVWGLRVDFGRVDPLPQVAQATRSFGVAYWARTDDGRAVTVDDAEFNVPLGDRDGAANKPKLLAGRPPDPTRVDELWVGSQSAQEHRLRVGSRLRVRFATQREVARIAKTGEQDPEADPATAGAGPLLTMRVAGIRAEVQSEDQVGWISATPAFGEVYGRSLGRYLELTSIRLNRGEADLDAFRAGVERIADGSAFEIYEKRTLTAKLRRSIHVQAQALWVLAVFGGLVVFVLVAQALARQVALESVDDPVLRSLGMTRRQLLAIGLLRVAPVAAAAGVIAAAIGIALSPLAPIGAARTAEPDPGLALDALVVGAGCSATAALVLLAGFAPAWWAAGSGAQDHRARSSPTVALLARSRALAEPRRRRSAGARARPRPHRGAGAHDAGQRDRRRRGGNDRVHHHSQRRPSPEHAGPLRTQLGRRDRACLPAVLLEAVHRRPARRALDHRSLGRGQHRGSGGG
jgi:hypothetical protein